MKKIFTFVFIFGLGVASYALIQTFLAPQEKESREIIATTTPVATDDQQETIIEDIVPEEDTITLAPDGTQLDGPFLLQDAQGNEIDGTVQIIRSPEEIVLQFKHFDAIHAADAHVYFASDKEATTYLDLSQAKLDEGVFIYGVPLDAPLDEYAYILIYDTALEKTEYYARVR